MNNENSLYQHLSNFNLELSGDKKKRSKIIKQPVFSKCGEYIFLL